MPSRLSLTKCFIGCKFRAVIGVAALLVAALSISAFAQNPSGTGPAAAAEAAKHFKATDGLSVSLFASEPMLRNPTDIDVDERGRVWVAEGVNYRSSFKPWGTNDPAGDRILILEDTNHDGRADKQTVFYQDPSINAALGVCVLGNKVIVSDSPNVFVLTDTDGDGRADKRELLFTGISGFDHDHGVHAFTFGPDGKVYFNMGNESKHLFYPVTKEVPLHGIVGEVPKRPVVDLEGNVVEADGKPYRNGLVFRCNPDGSEVETLAWNFRNNYEVAVDSFGTLWQSDNDDDGNRGVRINYLMEHGNFGYSDEMTGAGWSAGWEKAHSLGASEESKPLYEWHQYDPGVVPNLLNTGAGAPTGIILYEGSLLPAPFQNQMLLCEAGPRVVRVHPVVPDGAGYKASTKEMLTTDDTWFRPSDICAAPDGSVYISDWNDAGVGGHNMADQKLADMTGRIFRLAPGNGDSASRASAGARIPKLDLSTAQGCVAALQSPNLATRYLAWTRLHAMQAKAEASLLKLWRTSNPHMRARALQLLARIPGKGQHYTHLALKDREPNIRITGLRIARALKLNVIPAVSVLAHDPSAQVRREGALALRHNASPGAARLWAQLALQYDGRDRWYLEALGIGADKQWDRFLSQWLATVKNNWDTPAGHEIVWRSRSTNSPALLAKLITKPDASIEQQRHYLRSLDFITGPQKDSVLLQLAGLKKGAASPSKEIALEALSRLKDYDLGAKTEVKAAVMKMLQSLRGRPEFLELVHEFKIQGQENGILELTTKEPFDGSNIEAVRMLLHGHGVSLLQNALKKPDAQAIIRALGGIGSKEVVSLLSPLLANPNQPVANRKLAVQSLAQVKDGATALLKLAQNSEMPAELKLTAALELSQVRWQSIRDEAATILPLPQTREAKPLPPIIELAKQSGNSRHGAVLFRQENIGCFKCHQVNGEGTDFGPNLSEIGTKLGKDALYEAILEPSAGISFGYEAWQLTLKNGEEPYGLIASETSDEIAFKTVGGAVTKYKKADITSRVQMKTSIMPAGLQQTMSASDLVDLVEYLSTLKKVEARAALESKERAK